MASVILLAGVEGYGVRVLLILAIGVACAGCTDHGRAFPLDDASLTAGVPKFDFVRQGIGRGPVTVTMPDGEVLTGDYQVTNNDSVGVAFAGGQMATGFASHSGRPVAVNATGPRGTILTCDGALDIGGHGTLICQTNHGTHYRVMV
jgi:hypothetical protein